MTTRLLATIFLTLFTAMAGSSCGRGPDGRTVGSISAEPGKKSSSLVAIPRSQKSPWRLRFSVEEPKKQALQLGEQVVATISNPNSFPLDLYIGRGVGSQSLSAGGSLQFFEGTLEDLVLYGRLEEQDLTFNDSEAKAINVEVSVERKGGDHDIPLGLEVWRLHYGM
jgi:hypothetical protein